MDPDDYQTAWQSQASAMRVTVDADLLLKQMQRNQREFRSTIFRRDLVEVGVAAVLLPYWFYAGIAFRLPWTWYLSVPALIWVAGFILVDRIRHKRTPSEAGEPLLKTAQESLAQVEHQIWLLRNVLWWYLLPLGLPGLAFFADTTLFSRSAAASDWLSRVGAFAVLAAFLVALYGFIYWLNQRAVRADLEPRREELLALLANLGDESTGAQAVVRHANDTESSRALRRWIIAALASVAAVVVIVLARGRFDAPVEQAIQPDVSAETPLSRLVTDLRTEKQLVGLAAMVMVDGQVVDSAADGERKFASGVPVEIGDRWHIGGVTTSITATMIARLVESGRMQWTDTVGERFPDAPIHEDWKPVTLQQLLTHTSGAPKSFPKDVLRKKPALGPECVAERRRAVLDVIAQKPEHRPGEIFAYSNVGYTLAAAMAESAAGTSWEELVKREVFEPLELASAGFGPPKSPAATIDQPVGHRAQFGLKASVDDETDNTPIMNPAGGVHMTLGDLCKFATVHLRGELGISGFLSTDSYQHLHAPELDNYACGWMEKLPTNGFPHTIYWHNGTNTMWYALIVFIPGKDMAIAVTSNDGDFQQAEAAAWQIVKAGANAFQVEEDAAGASRRMNDKIDH